MGDTVNVAARLESQTKDYGQTILIGEGTYADAQAAIAEGKPPLAFLELDLIALKGKAQPQHIYALLGGADMAAGEGYQTLKAQQTDLLGAYRAQNWDVAEKTAHALADAHPALSGYYDMLALRINEYRKNPPQADWQGQFIALTK
jgi:adenylate cyclase